MPAKNALTPSDTDFILNAFFPSTRAANSLSRIAPKTRPNGEDANRQITATETAVTISEKTRNEKLSDNTNPKNSGRGIPGIPSGPLVTSVQFKATAYTTNEKPMVAKAK